MQVFAKALLTSPNMITHYYEDADALLMGLTALVPPSRQTSSAWKAQVPKRAMLGYE